jgi:hypothetical protein
MKEVSEFIDWHFKFCKDSYKILTGKKLQVSDYQVRNMDELLSFDEWKEGQLG